MRVISLGSGSSGNALLVEAGPQGRTKVLVDAGLSGRKLQERLLLAGASPAQLRAVLITHEHSDHILAIPYLLKRSSMSVMADPRTLEAIKQGVTSGLIYSDSGRPVRLGGADVECQVPERAVDSGSLGISDSLEGLPGADSIQPAISSKVTADASRYMSLKSGSSVVIGDLKVTSFATSHDAVAPCGYLLSTGGCRVCIVTDTGEATPGMLEAMNQADLLILESNHDRERLLRGPYPYQVKRRILSPTGHLSNTQAADAILKTWRASGIRWLWLAHLSRTNNTPQLALHSMRERVQAAKANLAQLHVTVLPPDIGHVWDSTQLWQMPSLWEMKK